MHGLWVLLFGAAGVCVCEPTRDRTLGRLFSNLTPGIRSPICTPSRSGKKPHRASQWRLHFSRLAIAQVHGVRNSASTMSELPLLAIQHEDRADMGENMPHMPRGRTRAVAFTRGNRTSDADDRYLKAERQRVCSRQRPQFPTLPILRQFPTTPRKRDIAIGVFRFFRRYWI